MLERIKQGTHRFFSEETLAERSKRIVPGILFGALAAILYIIVSTFINVLFYKNLHLGIDWIDFVMRCLSFGLALAVAGAIVGWFSETYEGIVFGGIVIAILLLAGNYIASKISGRSAALMGQSILITIIPLVGACILLAGVIRMALLRQSRIMNEQDHGSRRKHQVQLVLIVALVGMVLGSFSFFGTASVSTLRALNDNLQNYKTDPSIDLKFPYAQVPALKDHFGMDYYLYVRTSSLSAEAIDVSIHFKDGYAITCLVPLMSGNETLLLDTCNEGSRIH